MLTRIIQDGGKACTFTFAKNAHGVNDALLAVVGVKPQPTLFNGKLKMESGKLF